MKKVFCIAIDGPGHGGSEWFSTPEARDAGFTILTTGAAWDGATITKFDLEVPSALTAAETTQEVDDAMWCKDYEPIERKTVLVIEGATA